MSKEMMQEIINDLLVEVIQKKQYLGIKPLILEGAYLTERHLKRLEPKDIQMVLSYFLDIPDRMREAIIKDERKEVRDLLGPISNIKNENKGINFK